ncbi:MAG TPA: flagellar biosynthesis protein FlhA [Oligoflexia bacterium]|nr:flagellar biosynthesis protein FlhA [Oligoflexia bacterium]HMP27557.1 flagellar biosynthesis protein FlhA [Oligoflexia bacterium]
MFREYLLPIAILILLGSALVPLPAELLDYLLVGNSIFALLLLASTLYSREPLKLSAFPSILLLATLVRLVLNISTTRLVLTNGYAGEAVEAFGQVVVQGNLIVGIVLFLMIVIVQFIVVAKGSERVAEVCARFTLDALPGRQMAIDADVRAGLLDFESAKKKREDLQVESRFYGALDGAMKFVKGDAIAAIVVAFINIIGGISVGMLYQGMAFADAVNRFTILTIGDGLLAQIPALLNSLAAGLLVTRVNFSGSASLASDLMSQIVSTPASRGLAALAALALSLIPGFPHLPFFLIALALGLSTLFVGGPTNEEVGKKANIFVPRFPDKVAIKFSRETLMKIPRLEIEKAIEGAREKIFNDFGLIIDQPAVIVEAAREVLSVELMIRGIFAGSRDFEAGSFVEEFKSFLFEGLSVNLLDLLDDAATRRLLDELDKYAPELIANVIPNIASVTQITEIVRNLLSEGVAVKNFDLIMQAIAEYGTSKDQQNLDLLEEVRIRLKPIISSILKQRAASGLALIKGDLASDQREISLVTIDPVLDLNIIKQGNLPDPIIAEQVSRLNELLKSLAGQFPVVVCSKKCRRKLSLMLNGLGKQLVVAFEELTVDLPRKVIARFELGNEERENMLEQLAA